MFRYAMLAVSALTLTISAAVAQLPDPPELNCGDADCEKICSTGGCTIFACENPNARCQMMSNDCAIWPIARCDYNGDLCGCL